MNWIFFSEYDEKALCQVIINCSWKLDKAVYADRGKVLSQIEKVKLEKFEFVLCSR